MWQPTEATGPTLFRMPAPPHASSRSLRAIRLALRSRASGRLGARFAIRGQRQERHRVGLPTDVAWDQRDWSRLLPLATSVDRPSTTTDSPFFINRGVSVRIE